MRILLVEDNPDALKFFAEILKISGYRIEVARDGAEAIDKARRERFDLVMTDLELPKHSGLEIARALRAHEAQEAREPTPIMAVTAQDRESVRQETQQAGMQAFLAKPVRSRDLLNAVRANIDARTTVLIVDDAEQSRTLVAAWLSSNPELRALSVDRAGAALACLKRERIDIVLLDMVMPGIDGYAAARLMRTLPEAAGCAVVALTAKSGEEERAACLAAGCSEYLQKPVARQALLDLIARLARPAPGIKARAQPPSPAKPGADAGEAAIVLDEEAQALVPLFLENRRAELPVLEQALAARAFDALYRLGHNLRGSGGSYGFPRMTELGEALENAAKQQDASAAAEAIAGLRQQLAEALAARPAQ